MRFRFLIRLASNKKPKQKHDQTHSEKIRRTRCALNALTADWRVADADLEVLDFFAAAGKGDFELKIIGAIETGRGVIKCDQGRRFDRQALFEIGCLECGALDAHCAVGRWIRQPDRRQWS